MCLLSVIRTILFNQTIILSLINIIINFSILESKISTYLLLTSQLFTFELILPNSSTILSCLVSTHVVVLLYNLEDYFDSTIYFNSTIFIAIATQYLSSNFQPNKQSKLSSFKNCAKMHKSSIQDTICNFLKLSLPHFQVPIFLS